MRIMYDGIDSDAAVIPTEAELVAGYVDGDYAWSEEDWARFPHAVHVGIAVHPTTDAGIVLDCEPGNATPQEAVNWVLTRRHAGVDPTIYCNQQNPTTGWPAIRAAFQTHDVPEPHWWVADYDNVATIPAGAIAKQYQTTNRWDVSAVADYWPGVDPAPKPAPARVPQLEEDTMYLITAPSTAAANSPKAVFMLQGTEYVHVPDPAKYERLVKLGAKVGEVDYDTHAWLLDVFHGTAAAA